MMYRVKCTIHNVQFKVHNTQYKVYSAQYKVFTKLGPGNSVESGTTRKAEMVCQQAHRAE